MHRDVELFTLECILIGKLDLGAITEISSKIKVATMNKSSAYDES